GELISSSFLFYCCFVLIIQLIQISPQCHLLRFRGCVVRDFAFVAKKPRCRSLPVLDRTRHLTARLPVCHPGVSPIYYYPQALQCDCTTSFTFCLYTTFENISLMLFQTVSF
uniref:Uncharacterized protein n=1 Tax=Cyprinus carpio carpio TaxID=630221 RepID=A0A9J7Z727_CYPCA